MCTCVGADSSYPKYNGCKCVLPALDLRSLQYLKVLANISYISYGKVFGGTPNIFMFWLFPENGSISERIVNTLIVHTTV